MESRFWPTSESRAIRKLWALRRISTDKRASRERWSGKHKPTSRYQSGQLPQTPSLARFADYSNSPLIFLTFPRKDSTLVLGLYVSCAVGFPPLEHPGNKRAMHWYLYLVRAYGCSLRPVTALFCPVLRG